MALERSSDTQRPAAIWRPKNGSGNQGEKQGEEAGPTAGIFVCAAECPASSPFFILFKLDGCDAIFRVDLHPLMPLSLFSTTTTCVRDAAIPLILLQCAPRNLHHLFAMMPMHSSTVCLLISVTTWWVTMHCNEFKIYFAQWAHFLCYLDAKQREKERKTSLLVHLFPVMVSVLLLLLLLEPPAFCCSEMMKYWGS